MYEKTVNTWTLELDDFFALHFVAHTAHNIFLDMGAAVTAAVRPDTSKAVECKYLGSFTCKYEKSNTDKRNVHTEIARDSSSIPFRNTKRRYLSAS